jgi:hypothetical protein
MWKSGLNEWQLSLGARLERGLGRSLLPADLACIAWDLSGKTLSVVRRPLLAELRANNLTSNVFRTWVAGAATVQARRLEDLAGKA